MPLYKYVGNRILTDVPERADRGLASPSCTPATAPTGSMRCATSTSPSNTDDFDFDTEIILGLLAAGKRIAEVPIPTYYGDEICYVNGMAYAQDVADDVHPPTGPGRMGFGDGSTRSTPTAYDLKPSPHSSHGRLLDWLERHAARRVLDVGLLRRPVRGARPAPPATA